MSGEAGRGFWASAAFRGNCTSRPERDRSRALDPIGDEDVGLAGLAVAAIAAERELRAVGREHGERVEGRVEGDALEAGPVERDEVEVEVAPGRVLVVAREED